jgi:hypothetical protein
MSTMTTMLANVLALVAALGGTFWYRRRHARRVFNAEYAQLVAETQIDLAALRGPGREPTAQIYAHATPRRLSDADMEYYTSSWEHIQGEFAQSPAAALDLAEHLTAKLLLTRGLTPPEGRRPAALPSEWQFPTARGFRRAQLISARAQGAGPLDPAPSSSELRTALTLYRAFFREIMLLPAARDSEI